MLSIPVPTDVLTEFYNVGCSFSDRGQGESGRSVEGSEKGWLGNSSESGTGPASHHHGG
jgi:hypothetical protein